MSTLPLPGFPDVPPVLPAPGPRATMPLDPAELQAVDAERAERRHADAALVDLLRQTGFAGKAWNRVADSLAEYAVSVIEAWIATLGIFSQCRQRGAGCDPGPLQRCSARADIATELAAETVTKALPKFRALLQQGRWSHEKGASLTTYFIGQCVLQFPNVYRTWCRHEAPQVQEVLVGQIADPARLAGTSDPADTVISKDQVARALARMTAHDQTVIRLRLAGYATAEIAELLGVTKKAIEMTLYRQRAAITRKGGQA